MKKGILLAIAALCVNVVQATEQNCYDPVKDIEGMRKGKLVYTDRRYTDLVSKEPQVTIRNYNKFKDGAKDLTRDMHDKKYVYKLMAVTDLVSDKQDCLGLTHIPDHYTDLHTRGSSVKFVEKFWAIYQVTTKTEPINTLWFGIHYEIADKSQLENN